jgi:phosphatidylglycerophosphate synthase
MLDATMRRIIDPPLDRAAAELARYGVGANQITVVGFGLGLSAMAAIALEQFLLGLALLLLNRLADGLDGAVARRRGVTDLGGFLDIVLDFIVYSGIVFAFALADPGANALAAAFLIFSFIGTASSFLAFATMAAKRRLATDLRGHKSLYYLGGLTEGTETILVFVAFCLLPGQFAVVAWVFGALCWITTLTRVAVAAQLLDGPLPRPAALPGDD